MLNSYPTETVLVSKDMPPGYGSIQIASATAGGSASTGIADKINAETNASTTALLSILFILPSPFYFHKIVW
jgi:hypothetical protein